jgi:hypothetical protein
MSKKVIMSARAKLKPEVEKWVETRESKSAKGPTVKPKRLTIDIDPSLHTELKISCVRRGIQIADLVRRLIEADLKTNAS